MDVLEVAITVCRAMDVMEKIAEEVTGEGHFKTKRVLVALSQMHGSKQRVKRCMNFTWHNEIKQTEFEFAAWMSTIFYK